ncbi:MAG TPA: response regulator [Bordetella sp.]|jgi:FixJ family two-component response regulator|nr:response regulator [Bordetella sp.]
MAGASISMPGFPAGVSGVMSEPHSPAPTVFVLDDDISFGQALRRLLASVGLNAEVFDSAAALLRRGPVVHVSCLLLDVRLPGMCGLDLQAELKRARFNMPIIYMTGFGDIPMTVRAMKAGAIDFLAKPFRDQDMLDAIALALGRDRARHEAENIQGKLRGSYHYLTRRERQVMALVTSGMTNKSVAETLSVSEITVKVHRGNVMKKMGAKSLADLIRMADALAIDGAWLASVQEMGELQC